MEGLRKILATIAVLLLETGAFVFATLVGGHVDSGMLTAYFIAVAGSLAIYTGANVVSKSINANASIPMATKTETTAVAPPVVNTVPETVSAAQ